MSYLDKKPAIFRNEFIGFWYTFDHDIEIFVSLFNEIDDFSGCSYETAKKLIRASAL